jgi:methionine-rich copper-binding protein CopC
MPKELPCAAALRFPEGFAALALAVLALSLMSGPAKTALAHESVTEEESDQREVSLRDGRRLTVSEAGVDQLVEIRDEAGALEVRIRLTSEGPVLQMNSVRLQLRASEAVQIEAPTVELKGSERLELSGGQVSLHGEKDVEVEAEGDVRVVGKMIYLN